MGNTRRLDGIDGNSNLSSGMKDKRCFRIVIVNVAMAHALMISDSSGSKDFLGV